MRTRRMLILGCFVVIFVGIAHAQRVPQYEAYLGLNIGDPTIRTFPVYRMDALGVWLRYGLPIGKTSTFFIGTEASLEAELQNTGEELKGILWLEPQIGLHIQSFHLVLGVPLNLGSIPPSLTIVPFLKLTPAVLVKPTRDVELEVFLKTDISTELDYFNIGPGIYLKHSWFTGGLQLYVPYIGASAAGAGTSLTPSLAARIKTVSIELSFETQVVPRWGVTPALRFSLSPEKQGAPRHIHK